MAAAHGLGLEVTGVEPDGEMAALATTRAAGDVLPAGLPVLPVAAGSFDVVLANFVLNHVDDPRLGVRELARVAAPGGTVRATIWPGYPPPQARIWSEALDRAGAVRPDLPRLPEHLDFERSVDGFAALVSECGPTVVEARTLAWQWSVDPVDLLAGMSAVGNFGVTWRAQTPAVRERIAQAYAGLVAPLLDSGVLHFPVECVLVEAVAAGR
jgi:SAM-dependent methyltransferase